jgi:hypothetical protein
VDTRGFDRRLRLFGCACARQVWHLLPTDARSAVKTSERFAEGLATETDLRAAAIRLRGSPVTPVQIALEAAGCASAGWYSTPRPPPPDTPLVYDPRNAAGLATRALASEAAGPAPRYVPDSWHDAWNRAYDAARAVQADYVRDIFPPPGYTPQLHPDWLTSTVVALARQMDGSDDFSAAPILADALQDAGCDAEPVLQCCRAPGHVHVRGNWVVDLVLGRH